MLIKGTSSSPFRRRGICVAAKKRRAEWKAGAEKVKHNFEALTARCIEGGQDVIFTHSNMPQLFRTTDIRPRPPGLGQKQHALLLRELDL